jgi:cell division septation protein DedD
MKMHTFFLSGKAIAIVSGAFGACGMLLFVSGVLVGVRVQVDGTHGAAATTRSVSAAQAKPVVERAGPAAASQAASAGSEPGTPTASGELATPPAAPAAPASAATTADAGDVSAASASWPFASSAFAPSTFASPQPAPVETEAAPLPAADSPAQMAPAAPRAPVRRATMGDVSMIAYVAPADRSVADAPASAHSDPQPAERDNAEYLVQVGIFRVEQHAKELVDRLNNAGYRATITERQEGDRALHVVRVGRFTGIQTAEQAAARIGNAEQLVASVVAAPR